MYLNVRYGWQFSGGFEGYSYGNNGRAGWYITSATIHLLDTMGWQKTKGYPSITRHQSQKLENNSSHHRKNMKNHES